jgi:YD repeat-containing protein
MCLAVVKKLPFHRSIVILLFFIHPLTFAQLNTTRNPFAVNVVPPSPEAAALAKYADIPISLYSGTPQIGISLYFLQERDLKLPILLSYHGSGNKVETVAQRTGLGWSLQCGGVITRSLRGWPDEHSNEGFLSQIQRFQVDNVTDGTDSELLDRYDQMANGCKDMEPDQFYFNFGKYTGKFVFDWDGKVKIETDSKLIIVPYGMHPGTDDFIDGFRVIGEDGTQYLFDAIETTDVISPSDNSISCKLGLNEKNIPQSWYLKEIRSVNEQSLIRFEYEPYVQTTEAWSLETQMHNEALSPAIPQKEKLQISIYGKHLRKITTASGQTTIDFISGAQRRDVTGTVYTLGEIIVRNNRGRIVKHWKFSYDDITNGKLMLKTLQEWAGDLSRPPYEFKYYNGILPDALSFSRDHWGFYNSNSVQTLIRQVKAIPLGGNREVELYGANREPDQSKVLYGVLREIKYPTGGKDVIDFESHDYSFEQSRELVENVTIGHINSVSAPRDGAKIGEQDIQTEIFTLPVDTEVHINGSLSRSEGGFGSSYPSSIEIIDEHGTQQFHRVHTGLQSGISINETKFLSRGTYTIIAKGIIRRPPGVSYAASVDIRWQEPTGELKTLTKYGGGIRISKMTRSFGNGNPDKITKYQYTMQEDGREKSSGSLLESDYHYERWIDYIDVGQNPVRKFLRFAQNRCALGTTQGSHVGYGQVIVLYGEDGENGKSVYKYNSPREITDYGYYDFPYPPANSYDYKRGLLREQLDYDTSNQIIHRVVNTYEYYQQDVKGFKAGWKVPGPGLKSLGRYAVQDYSNILGYSRLVKSEESHFYEPHHRAYTTGTVYQFGEETHKQPSLIIQRDSKGDSVYTHITYPLDYSESSPVLNTMKDLNMANAVMEKLSWKKDQSGSLKLLSAVKTGYRLENDKVLPADVSTSRIADPVPTTNPLGTAAGLYEMRMQFNAYDQFGNLRSQALKDGSQTSYIWNESGTALMAKVELATPQQIFYTSFEDDGASQYVPSKTGIKSKSLHGAYAVPANLRPTTSGTYIMTYWKRSLGGEWQYEEKVFEQYTPGAAMETNAVNGFIDEIRVYPRGARMTTYVYEPLVGITSVTDPNNVTQYFEYDVFGHLSCKRNEQKNIIQCYDYQYQDPVAFESQSSAITSSTEK